MGSLIDELRRREAAARADADRLRARIEELAEELSGAEERASRLAITLVEVTRVLEEPATAEPPPEAPGEPRPASPIGAVTVPPWQEGADASALPQSYQDLLEVAADAGRPLRAREFAAAAGLPTDKAKVEGLRSKLRLLAERGWLAPAPGGLYELNGHGGKTALPGQWQALLPRFGGAYSMPDLKEEEPSVEDYCPVPPDDPFTASRALFGSLAASLAARGAAVLTACELEDLLAEKGREVLRQLLQDHLDLRAAREEEQARGHRAPVTGTDGITRSRLEAGHRRLLATMFGTVRVARCAWRRPGARNYCPADAALSLPAGRHSHSLARLAAIEAARGSFDDAHDAVTRRCGPVIGKRQLEEAAVRAACDIPAFYATRVPGPRTAQTLLILSADCKGIVMRPGALRAATARAAARLGKMRTRLSAGEKPNRKRMAALVTVYDAEPARRRPHDIIAPPGGRHGARELRPGPKALARWLAGSVRNDPAEVIAAMFDQAEARDPLHLRTWVVLVDGAEHQLALIRAEAARQGAAIQVVIDLIHVLELSAGPDAPSSMSSTVLKFTLCHRC